MDTEKHRGNTSGLIPWKPGQSGNPKGRPKNVTYISEELRKFMQSVPALVGKDGKPNTSTGAELIALAWFKGMMKGNPALLKEALDRLEGKVAQPVEIGGNDGEPINAIIQVVSENSKALTREIINGKRTEELADDKNL